MRRFTLAFLTLALTACAVAAWDDPAAEYLALREELGPAPSSSRISLRQILSTGDFGHVELVGNVCGKASSGPSLPDQPHRTLMLSLDDGSSVALRAGDEIEALRVGHRISVIAATRATTSSDELTLESWVHEIDLPREPEPLETDANDEEQAEAPGPSVREFAPGSVGTPRSDASPLTETDAIEIWKAWVLDHNSKLSGEQARDIARWVLHYSHEYNVNHRLIFALIKWESWFNPGCISHAGAIGLMQLMPGTARGLGVDPYNVQQNIRGGTRYLAEQLGKYADRPTYERVILALACYNAGPNAVKRAGHRVPNIRETQNYVKKVSKTFHELHEAGMP